MIFSRSGTNCSVILEVFFVIRTDLSVISRKLLKVVLFVRVRNCFDSGEGLSS